MESAQRAKLDQTVLGMETKMNALSLEVLAGEDRAGQAQIRGRRKIKLIFDQFS